MFSNYRIVTLLSALALTVAGCGASPGGPLASTRAAHGGLDTYRAYKSVAYDLSDWPFAATPPLHDRQTIDLTNRTVHIHGANNAGGAYTVVFDGKDAWVDDPAALGLPARFYYNTPFYFFAMPFVFADPGVKLESLPDFTTGDGKTYRVLRASYGAGVGDAPDDDYVLYIDPTTGRLEFAHYIVTFRALADQNKTPEEMDRHVIAFDWQTVDGLLVPATFHFHHFDAANITGAPISTVTINNVQFSASRPDQTLFQKPAGAVADRSHL